MTRPLNVFKFIQAIDYQKKNESKKRAKAKKKISKLRPVKSLCEDYTEDIGIEDIEYIELYNKFRVLQSDDHEDYDSKLEKEQILLPRPFALTAEKILKEARAQNKVDIGSAEA
ncbi:hypothetical protein DFQ28_004591 [Apophysomyces sp. BC1034]|nr:hypothetical protein DFQ28_004591 [Apophysomyces sp. BC1034]